MAGQTEDYLTLADLAAATGITRTTLYAHIRRGNLKAKKLGFFTVVPKDEAERFKSRLRTLQWGQRTVTVFQ